MDLNYLHHRQGVERLRAEHADSHEARESHAGLADLFRDRIEIVRRDRHGIASPEL